MIVTELYGGTILTPQQYVAALRRHSPAPIIALSTVLPCTAEVTEWGLWCALHKHGRPTSLVDAIVRAHRVVRGTTSR